MFRAGRVDEPLASGGINHLLEHLALFPLGQQSFQYNGVVDWIRTVFAAAGSPDEVGTFLARTVASIAAPPEDRFDAEAHVLRDEASRRSSGLAEHHAQLRFGAVGPGVTDFPEFGLYRLTPPDLRAWGRARFTADNAALVWIGPKPPTLDWRLPRGSRMLPTTPPELVTGPVFAAGPENVVSVSLMAPRTSAGAMAVRILTRRLQQSLRYERGISYEVNNSYLPLSKDSALAVVSASTQRADATTVRSIVLKALADIRDLAPRQEEIDVDRDALRRSQEHPFAAQGQADWMALQSLLDAPRESFDDLEAEAAKVGPNHVREAIDGMARRAILVQPEGLIPPAPPGYEPYPDKLTGQAAGTIYRSVADSGIGRRRPRLVVGVSAAGFLGPAGVNAAFPFADTQALVVRADSAAVLVQANGNQLTVDPRVWRRADEAIQGLLTGVPADRVVRIPSDGSYEALRRTTRFALQRFVARFRHVYAVIGALAAASGAGYASSIGSGRFAAEPSYPSRDLANVAAGLLGLGVILLVAYVALDGLSRRRAGLVGSAGYALLFAALLTWDGGRLALAVGPGVVDPVDLLLIVGPIVWIASGDRIWRSGKRAYGAVRRSLGAGRDLNAR